MARQQRAAKASKEFTSAGRARTRPARPFAARFGRRDLRSTPRCAARASSRAEGQGRSAGAAARSPKGHRALHAPARDHDEGRRAAAAVLRHRGQGRTNPAVAKLLPDIKTDVETGLASQRRSASSAALRRALLQPGPGRRAGRHSREPARPPGDLQGKDPRHQVEDQGALFYPIAIIAVAFIITAVIMIFVIPAFKEVFTNFGADLPAPTLMVMASRTGSWPTGTSSSRSSAAASTASSKPGSARWRCRSSWTGSC